MHRGFHECSAQELVPSVLTEMSIKQAPRASLDDLASLDGLTDAGPTGNSVVVGWVGGGHEP